MGKTHDASQLTSQYSYLVCISSPLCSVSHFKSKDVLNLIKVSHFLFFAFETKESDFHDGMTIINT